MRVTDFHLVFLHSSFETPASGLPGTFVERDIAGAHPLHAMLRVVAPKQRVLCFRSGRLPDPRGNFRFFVNYCNSVAFSLHIHCWWGCNDTSAVFRKCVGQLRSWSARDGFRSSARLSATCWLPQPSMRCTTILPMHIRAELRRRREPNLTARKALMTMASIRTTIRPDPRAATNRVLLAACWPLNASLRRLWWLSQRLRPFA